MTWYRVATILTVAMTLPRMLWAAQPLETETARLPTKGRFGLEAGVERQTSEGGTELALPFALEFGLTNHTELLVEPVFFTAINDNGFPGQSGVGDVETTITERLWTETSTRPAFALAGEVKVPTAANPRIGSGKTDVAGLLIASKRWGRWDTHANASYTIIGQPTGVQVNNTFGFGLAEEFHPNDRTDLLGEVFGSTSSLPEQSGVGESTLTPELGGAELVAAIGIRYRDGGRIVYSLGLSLDNQGAILVHPGLARTW